MSTSLAEVLERSAPVMGRLRRRVAGETVACYVGPCWQRPNSQVLSRILRVWNVERDGQPAHKSKEEPRWRSPHAAELHWSAATTGSCTALSAVTGRASESLSSTGVLLWGADG